MSKDIKILIEAINCDNTDKIKQLVNEQGFNINAKDKNGTPVVFHVFKNCGKLHYETLETSKNLGANFNVKTVEGRTFLNRAVEYGNLDVVKYILQQSIIQIDMIGNDGKYPLLIATENRNEDMVKLLAEEFKANLNTKDKNGNPLIFSVLTQHHFKYDMAMLLIELGVDVNQKNNVGDTPLKFAVQAQIYDVVEKMLQKGALPNAKDKNDNYIMHFAYETKNEDIIRLLVQYKANIDCKNIEGDTLLVKAVGGPRFHYDYKMVNLLLELGANPNSKDEKGESIIFKIIDNGKPETLDIFLNHNGKINVFNKNKKSPAQVAIDKQKPEILESLLKFGASHIGLFSDDSEIKEILDHYMDLGGNIPQDNT